MITLFLAAGIWDYVRTFGQYIYSTALTLGGPGLFLVALADSSFLSVPEGNDILIVILSTGQTWERMSYYVLMTIMGSVTGCSLLYLVGRRSENYVHRKLRGRNLNQVLEMYRKWGLWAVVIPSILPPPTPFKVFVLAAGISGISYRRFFLAVLVGRSIRYFMWGILAVLYGELARQFLEDNIQLVGMILFVLFLIAGVAFWYKMRRKTPQGEAV
ncbi:MAG TPA: VTT domain-containing protein [Acidobacteriota bacterium]|nr:VTT domain-containing protein [Acidobacteriota bacterium]